MGTTVLGYADQRRYVLTAPLVLVADEVLPSRFETSPVVIWRSTRPREVRFRPQC